MISRLRELERPILKYYVYSITTSVGFYTPVLYVLFLSEGLTYTEIALLESVFMVTTLIGEVPTGWVGDKIGWRRSLYVATVLIALTVAGMAVASSVVAFGVLHVTWSLGYNFRSGSEDAWLYEAVSQERDSEAFAGVQGRAQSVSLVAGTVSALAGGALAGMDLMFPFFAAAAVTLFGLPVLVSLPAVEGSRDEEFSYREAVGVVGSLFQRSDLRWFVLFILLITYLVATANVFTQPLAKGIGITEAGLGVLYAGFKLVSAGASYVVEDVRSLLGERRLFILGPLFIGAGFLVVLVEPLLVIPAFFVARAVQTLLRPVGYQRINDEIETTGRATALSGVAMVGSILGIGAKFGAGRVADVTTPTTTLAVIGLVLAVTTVVMTVGRFGVTMPRPRSVGVSIEQGIARLPWPNRVVRFAAQFGIDISDS